MSKDLIPPTGYDRHTTSSNELDILDTYGCLGSLNILTLRRIFLLLTRNFFSDSSNFNVAIQQDWLRNFSDYTYSDPVVDPDGEVASTIDIQATFQYADNASRMEYLKEGQKPTIFINVGDFNYQNFNTIDNISKIVPDGSGSIQGYNIKCNVTFSCYALSYGDSAMMSQLVASFISGIRPMMLKKLNLQEYKALQLTAPVCINPDDANKQFKSEFTLELTFENVYRAKVESLRIKSIGLELLEKNLS